MKNDNFKSFHLNLILKSINARKPKKTFDLKTNVH